MTLMVNPIKETPEDADIATGSLTEWGIKRFGGPKLEKVSGR